MVYVGIVIVTCIVIAMLTDIFFPEFCMGTFMGTALRNTIVRFKIILLFAMSLLITMAAEVTEYWYDGHFEVLPMPYKEWPAHKRFFYIIYDFFNMMHFSFSDHLHHHTMTYMHCLREDGVIK